MKKRKKSECGRAKTNTIKVAALNLKRTIKHALQDARGALPEGEKLTNKQKRRAIYEAKSLVLGSDWGRPKHKVPRMTDQECATYLLEYGWTKGRESWVKPHPQGGDTLYKTLRQAVKLQRWLTTKYGC